MSEPDIRWVYSGCGLWQCYYLNKLVGDVYGWFEPTGFVGYKARLSEGFECEPLLFRSLKMAKKRVEDKLKEYRAKGRVAEAVR